VEPLEQGIEFVVGGLHVRPVLVVRPLSSKRRRTRMPQDRRNGIRTTVTPTRFASLASALEVRPNGARTAGLRPETATAPFWGPLGRPSAPLPSR
jgi:hypothetical protein